VAQKELNLGIVAHVDAGKTTLTERLLYEAGVITEIGSVDAGTTQTDSLALERERGITIRSAVTSFALGDVHVNLIDTPGHPDFIAEVERVLGVLDGAVLVISAVEGVQPQTRVLMNALSRLRVPTLMFVNKIDRGGASSEQVLDGISERLTRTVVPMGVAHEQGSSAAYVTLFDVDNPAFQARAAEVLAEDESFLAAYVNSESALSGRSVRDALAAQTRRSLVYPIFFGSAITGAGVAELMEGIRELLPATAGDECALLAAKIFKIERGPTGERIAYARVFSGTVRTRETIPIGAGANKVTAITVFEAGEAVQRPSVSAGGVAKLWGLDAARVGDRIGSVEESRAEFRFSPPTLESIVVPRDPAARALLATALSQLAEQDPLINVQQNDLRHEISVSLYGEVQQEVIAATLAREYGIEVGFHDPTPICVERVIGSASAVDELAERSNPFLAGIGFRVEAAPIDSGLAFAVDVELRSIPLYVYKTVPNFAAAMEEYVRATLDEGLAGWRVTDCSVTMIHCGYASPGTGARDYRRLTPLVLMRALAAAGTRVCEPFVEARIETPVESTPAVFSALSRLGAGSPAVTHDGDVAVFVSTLPANRLSDLQRQLPGLTGGEGLVETHFAGYEPVAGAVPTRPRRTISALNRDEYLSRLAGRMRGGA
jgi:ribosomal protection tetracycline resistance protein